MTTFSEVSIYDWQADIQNVLDVVERAELDLSYTSACVSEHDRKQSGSYYTPQDVARFFWNEFFSVNKINTKKTAIDFILNNQFIEPAAGSGVLVFALLLKLLSLGVALQTLVVIKIKIIDINQKALKFIQSQFDCLANKWQIKFKNVELIRKDFMRIQLTGPDKSFMVFANPPFVKKEASPSSWKNSFADFVEKSSDIVGMGGSMNFTIPLSFSFSRDYKKLRELITKYPREITISHFDNIPDTLFKSGKPQHTNTNKANSQRCAILTIRPARIKKVYSTKLHGWSKAERSKLLSNPPIYHDVTAYRFDDQIPRPENLEILNYLNRKEPYVKLGKLCSVNGVYTLNVAAVARNYIGIRDDECSSATKLCFANKLDFYRALLVMTSDIFFCYWRTVGDGFHVTKANIYNFPLHDDLKKKIDKELPTMRRLWSSRKLYKKTKMNAGYHLHSYDFSGHIRLLLGK